jgi:hypothetical protein
MVTSSLSETSPPFAPLSPAYGGIFDTYVESEIKRGEVLHQKIILL